MKALSPANLIKSVPDHGRKMWASVSDAAARAYVACHIEKILTACMWLIVSTIILVGTLLMVLCVLWCCFLGGVASSVAVRHLMLRNIPEHQVLPLELEVASLQTEPWRWLELPAAVERSWESDGGRWLRRKAQTRNSYEHGDVSICEGSLDSTCSGGRDKESKPDGAAPPASSPRTSLTEEAKIAVDTLRRQTNLISNFQRQQWQSLVCHGLVRIRGVPSESDGGDGDGEDLFLPTETPIFNAAGRYSATLQLVFLKRRGGARRPSSSSGGGGDPVSVSVHTTMLAAPRHHAAVSSTSTPPLWRLTSVFRREHGTSFLSGEIVDDRQEGSIASFASQCLDLMLYMPRAALRLAWSVFQEGSSVFPPLAMDGSEVAVDVPLYHRFHPPMELQHRLAALNISVFQRLDDAIGGDDEDDHVHEPHRLTASDGYRRHTPARKPSHPRLHVVRANVYFSVQLEGLAYLLTEYPILSAAVMTCIFFVMYVLWCACVAVGIMSGGVFLALKL